MLEIFGLSSHIFYKSESVPKIKVSLKMSPNYRENKLAQRMGLVTSSQLFFLTLPSASCCSSLPLSARPPPLPSGSASP